jgi:hypothetical protein
MHIRERDPRTVQALNSKFQGLEKKEQKPLVHSSCGPLSTTTTLFIKKIAS